MLRNIRNLIRFRLPLAKESQGKSRDLPKGQMAILLILIIAVIFIFLPVVINLGKVNQIKTLTTTASNLTAAFLASEMASFAESLYQYYGGQAEMGDDLTVCKHSSVMVIIWKRVILVAILIALIIVAAIFCKPALPYLVTSLKYALIASAITIGLQLAVIQPAIMDRINRIYRDLNFDTATEFLDRGIMVGLQNSVDDNERVVDLWDHDSDGVFGVNMDEISRFGKLLSDRLEGYRRDDTYDDGVDAQVIADFLSALQEFLYVTDGPNDWGVFDPVSVTCGGANPHDCCDDAIRPAGCNCCCLPDGSEPGNPDIHPGCCDAAEDACGNSDNCSPPYVFDPFFENDTNTLTSFREFFGRDDGNRFYRTDVPGNPNHNIYRNSQIPDADAEPWPYGILRKEDATGVFRDYWDLYEGTELPQDDGTGLPDSCFWCSFDDSDSPCFGDPDAWISLPEDCTGVDDCCITQDSYDPVSNAVDLIPDDICWDFTIGWWKRGSADECSTVWPYDYDCPGIDCAGDAVDCPDYCSEDTTGNPDCAIDDNPNCRGDDMTFSPDPLLWPQNDLHDSFRPQIDEFINWALTSPPGRLEDITQAFDIWVAGFDQWLGASDDEGRLYEFSTILQGWEDNFQGWLDGPYVGACGETVDDIISCLDTKRYRANCYDVCESTLDGSDTWAACSDAIIDWDSGFDQSTWEAIWGQYCGAGHPSSLFTDWLEEEIPADDVNDARNIAVLAEARHDHLFDLAGTPDSPVIRIRDGYHDAAAEITSFLNDPSVSAIRQEKNRLVQDPTHEYSIKPWVIYSWKDKKGYWHIVKSEAVIPRKCAGRCGREPNYEPEWPRFNTYLKNFLGRSQCTSLGDSFDRRGNCADEDDYDDVKACFRGGRVMSRITRYDQDRDFMFKLMNNIPLWRVVFHHPDRNPAPQSLINSLESRCDPNGYEAFMTYDHNELDPGPNYWRCYNTLGTILERGVMSESCADYFFHEASPYGFAMKFVNCRDGTGESPMPD